MKHGFAKVLIPLLMAAGARAAIRPVSLVSRMPVSASMSAPAIGTLLISPSPRLSPAPALPLDGSPAPLLGGIVTPYIGVEPLLALPEHSRERVVRPLGLSIETVEVRYAELKKGKESPEAEELDEAFDGRSRRQGRDGRRPVRYIGLPEHELERELGL